MEIPFYLPVTRQYNADRLGGPLEQWYFSVGSARIPFEYWHWRRSCDGLKSHWHKAASFGPRVLSLITSEKMTTTAMGQTKMMAMGWLTMMTILAVKIENEEGKDEEEEEEVEKAGDAFHASNVRATLPGRAFHWPMIAWTAVETAWLDSICRSSDVAVSLVDLHAENEEAASRLADLCVRACMWSVHGGCRTLAQQHRSHWRSSLAPIRVYLACFVANLQWAKKTSRQLVLISNANLKRSSEMIHLNHIVPFHLRHLAMFRRLPFSHNNKASRLARQGWFRCAFIGTEHMSNLNASLPNWPQWCLTGVNQFGTFRRKDTKAICTY